MKPFFGLLTNIVSLLETFVTDRKKQDISLEKFVLWLNREVLYQEKDSSSARSHDAEHEAHAHQHASPRSSPHGPRANVRLTLLLHTLSKHFKLYSKKVLLDSDLVSMDGHMFLSMVYHTDSIRKMELIKANYTEAPSGIEVIKRLLKKGFIEEFDDPEDRRSKRVRITEKGKTKYEETLPPLGKVIDIMAGDMSDDRKLQLISLLDELNDFHGNLHNEAKNMTLDQLLERV